MVIRVPEIPEFVHKNNDRVFVSRTELASYLDFTLYKHLCPLLLVTSSELGGFDGMGSQRAKHVLSQLPKSGLKLRPRHERASKYVIKQYGSIQAVPIQALAVRVPKDDMFVQPRRGRIFALDEIVARSPKATLGQFLATPDTSTEELLRTFVREQRGGAVMERDFDRIFDELTELLEYWQAAVGKPVYANR